MIFWGVYILLQVDFSGMVGIKATKMETELYYSLEPSESIHSYPEVEDKVRSLSSVETTQTRCECMQAMEIRVTHTGKVSMHCARDLLKKLYSVKYDGISLGWQSDTGELAHGTPWIRAFLRPSLSIRKNNTQQYHCRWWRRESWASQHKNSRGTFTNSGYEI
jgi:hypothetical protein